MTSRLRGFSLILAASMTPALAVDAAQVNGGSPSRVSAGPADVYVARGANGSPIAVTSNGVRDRTATRKHSDTGNWPLVRRAVAGEENIAAVQFLEQRVVEVNWEDEPLESIIEWMRQRGEVNVIPVWKTLETVGVQPDTPVSLTLRDVSVHELLVEMCEQLSPYDGVGFLAQRNIIKLSTQEHLDRKLYVRVYEVRDVIFEVQDFGVGVCDTYRDVKDRMEDLAKMVRLSIDPERWAENGGDCSVQPFETTLVVRAPISIHQKLGGPFYGP